MDFTDVIKDLVKLEGLLLHSIRPGADIVIENVDVELKKITIRNSSGKIQNRYFIELERIWEALLASPAIRVEDVLNGSGSSRNQPETIFANLPYIEWLKLNNKKHIAYVGKATHPYGTIQQMNQALANKLEHTSPETSQTSFVLIISNDIAKTAALISSHLGGKAKAIAEGIYEFSIRGQLLVLTSAHKSGIQCGTYYHLPISSNYQCSAEIELFDRKWGIYLVGELKIISEI